MSMVLLIEILLPSFFDEVKVKRIPLIPVERSKSKV
jgi:hypothetical protein